MRIGNSRIGDWAVVRLEGRMDAASEHAFERESRKLVDDGARRIAVDLERLTYISSAGIGALIRLAASVRDRNGEVALCGAKGVVKSVLEITRVITLFRLFGDLGEVESVDRPVA